MARSARYTDALHREGVSERLTRQRSQRCLGNQTNGVPYLAAGTALKVSRAALLASLRVSWLPLME